MSTEASFDEDNHGQANDVSFNFFSSHFLWSFYFYQTAGKPTLRMQWKHDKSGKWEQWQRFKCFFPEIEQG